MILNYNCVCLFCLGSENDNHTVHFATISSHAEPEEHEDVVSRKQHFWFIHGLVLDQHVSNKMAVLLVLYMLITRGV